jgi:hypothetical protein
MSPARVQAAAVRHNARMTRAVSASPAIAPSPSSEEAAAIVAAIERFIRATAAPVIAPAEVPDEWRHAAILEGVEREGPGDVPDPWINT